VHQVKELGTAERGKWVYRFGLELGRGPRVEMFAKVGTMPSLAGPVLGFVLPTAK